MANPNFFFGSDPTKYFVQPAIIIGQVNGQQGSNLNVPMSHLFRSNVGIPTGHPAMPTQLLSQTMFRQVMDPAGNQGSSYMDPIQQRPRCIVTEISDTQTAAPDNKVRELDKQTEAPDKIVTKIKHTQIDDRKNDNARRCAVKSDVDSQPAKKQRHIEVFSFVSRREELIQSNKPYYRYVPTILNTWKRSDYLKHKDLFLEADPSTVHPDKELEELSLDISQLVKGRNITFKPFCMDILKQSMKPIQRTDRWWIVSDTKVLLDDMKFMDKLIKSDRTCRMRLPYEVLHDLSAMTRKKHQAWMRIPARRVAQYLDVACDVDQIIIVQSVIEKEDLLDSPVATDAVLNCCLQLTKMYYYVVVITDDKERQKRAASVELPWFSLERVKELVQSSFKDENNSTKRNITVSCTFDTSGTAAMAGSAPMRL